MAGNDVDINQVIQILRFSGDGLSWLIKNGTKAGKFMSDRTKVRAMQLRMALYYHSSSEKVNYNLLSLRTLTKITGDQYSVINLPTEDTKCIQKFCDSLKKHKIQAALMPDLCIGDGMIQLAVNPQQASRLQALVERFDFSAGKEVKKGKVRESNKAKAISFDEYAATGTEEAKTKIIEEAAENISEKRKNEKSEDIPRNSELTEESMKQVVKFDEIKSKRQDKDYYPIRFRKDSILAENDKAYIAKVNNSYDVDSGSFLLMAINKNDVMEKGDDMLTHVKKDGFTKVFNSSSIKEGMDVKKLSKVKNKTIPNEELLKKYFDTALKLKSKNQNTKPIVFLPKGREKK